MDCKRVKVKNPLPTSPILQNKNGGGGFIFFPILKSKNGGGRLSFSPFQKDKMGEGIKVNLSFSQI
jgi:hypothetical protein